MKECLEDAERMSADSRLVSTSSLSNVQETGFHLLATKMGPQMHSHVAFIDKFRTHTIPQVSNSCATMIVKDGKPVNDRAENSGGKWKHRFYNNNLDQNVARDINLNLNDEPSLKSDDTVDLSLDEDENSLLLADSTSMQSHFTHLDEDVNEIRSRKRLRESRLTFYDLCDENEEEVGLSLIRPKKISYESNDGQHIDEVLHKDGQKLYDAVRCLCLERSELLNDDARRRRFVYIYWHLASTCNSCLSLCKDLIGMNREFSAEEAVYRIDDGIEFH